MNRIITSLSLWALLLLPLSASSTTGDLIQKYKGIGSNPATDGQIKFQWSVEAIKDRITRNGASGSPSLFIEKINDFKSPDIPYELWNDNKYKYSDALTKERKILLKSDALGDFEPVASPSVSNGVIGVVPTASEKSWKVYYQAADGTPIQYTKGNISTTKGVPRYMVSYKDINKGKYLNELGFTIGMSSAQDSYKPTTTQSKHDSGTTFNNAAGYTINLDPPAPPTSAGSPSGYHKSESNYVKLTIFAPKCNVVPDSHSKIDTAGKCVNTQSNAAKKQHFLFKKGTSAAGGSDMRVGGTDYELAKTFFLSFEEIYIVLPKKSPDFTPGNWSSSVYLQYVVP